MAVSVSKTNRYSVLAPATGTTIAKANRYVVLSSHQSVSIAKANRYVVLQEVFQTTAYPVMIAVT